MLKAKIGEGNEVLNQILAERVAQPTGDFQLGFVPTTGPNIQWEAPEFNIEYEMDKLNFSARIGKGDFEFIPGSIELQIEQMPDIRIEYIGNRSMYRRVQQNALKASRSMYRLRRS